MLDRLLKGNWEILKFYIKTFPFLIEIMKSQIGKEIGPPPEKNSKPFQFEIDSKLAENYNNEYQEMKKNIIEKNKDDQTKFTNKMINFFFLRIICCVTAFYNYFYLTIFISNFQFLILPYSFSVSLISFYEMASSIFLGSYLYYPIAFYLKDLFVSWTSLSEHYLNLINYTIELDDKFILYFFIVDFLVCLIFTYYSPKGKTKRMPISRILQSILYGFINTKSYFLILFFLSRGVKISIFLWIFEGAFSLSEKLVNLIQRMLGIRWSIIFYHQHRVAHLPYVYNDAHKFHHYLHDSSPFDAHIYGTGAPEEWYSLLAELLPSFYFGCHPPSLSFYALKTSLYHKIGHTRKENGNNQEVNHADHHTYHTRNYSWIISLEMFLGTAVNNSKMDCNFYVISKEIKNNGKTVFTYEPKNIIRSAFYNFIAPQ
jgi:hypothetical protein